MTSKSKFNVSDIFKKHRETLRTTLSYDSNGNEITINRKISGTDKFTYYVLPWLISLTCLLLVGRPAGELVSLYTACLSLFIGLFLNMLVLIIAALRPNYPTQDKNTRKRLIEYTFYNISYTVIASVIALGLLFLSLAAPFPESCGISLRFLQNQIPSAACDLPANSVTQTIFSFLFYYMLVKIILTLLMILKKTYSLFKIDIKNSEHTQNNL